MSKASKAGIETAADGASYIPASKRADGSTRKEIRVKPGYKPPEDVETYRNRSAEAWKNRGQGGVPGAEPIAEGTEDSSVKSKNAKRREAVKRKAALGEPADEGLTSALQNAQISDVAHSKGDWRTPQEPDVSLAPMVADHEVERQKKIRNQLKKLKAVRELKDKKADGEKLSPDQLMKVGKEGELLRDLKKLGYDGEDLQSEETTSSQPLHQPG